MARHAFAAFAFALLVALPVQGGVDVDYARLYIDEYTQPTWDRRDTSKSQLHTLLQQGAQLHQDGDLDKAVQTYKKAVQQDPKSGEAYASLSKVLNDQGKHDLADKARAKAVKINNAALHAWSLF